MTPGGRSDTEALLPQTSEISTSYPLATLSRPPVKPTDSVQTSNNNGPATPSTSTTSGDGYPLRRFPARTLLLILVPPAITIYFILVYILFVSDDPENFKYGHRNGGHWVYYSWFIIGVFGLNTSRYGLAGVEAAMLQEDLWQTDNAKVLLFHSGQSWSGFGGWLKLVSSLFLRKRKLVQRLWCLLALLSLLISIGLPLSGLSLELFDGYVKSSEHPKVIGYRLEDFNRRLSIGQYYQPFVRGTKAWTSAAPVTLPAIGIAYTPSYLDRGRFDFLQRLPNSFPLEGGVPDIFITAQARYPINGRAWGLRLRYNCSMVQSASEFTILSKKSSVYAVSPNGNYSAELLLPGDETIYATTSAVDRMIHNLYAYSEMGVSSSRWAHYDGQEPASFDEEGVGKADILEYALWQIRSLEFGDRIEFNDEIAPSVSGLEQAFVRKDDGTVSLNTTFVYHNASGIPMLGYNLSFHAVLTIAPPIGVRCHRLSALGTAELQAKSFSFHSFQRSPSPPFNQSETERQTPRFGGTTTNILINRYEDFFSSTNTPMPKVFSTLYSYTSFLRPQVLMESILRAHAVDAMQLMYDGINNLEKAYINPNLTSSKPGKIIGRGTIPPLVPVTFLGLWSLGCIVLGCTYGFRRRWSETLDGFSFLRFGVNLGSSNSSSNHHHRLRLRSTVPFEECEELRQVPGMIGDLRMTERVGRIGLVPRGLGRARKDKLYN